ncbi:MAG: hypothetical protein ACYSUC_00410 [Planctomycetota bacterium]
MNRIESLCLAACLSLLLGGGCTEVQRSESVEPLCVRTTNEAEIMQTAEDVLGQIHFVTDKADAEQGYIRTRPLSGAQFFEFWRSDNVGAFNCLQANLHSIRRITELDISRQQGQLCIACNVHLQRLSLPEREVSSSTRTYEMFSKSTARMQRLQLRPEQKRQMAWVNLGSDTKLATEILTRIGNRLEVKDRR